MGKFQFGMDLCKAWEQDGEWYVEARVSDTRLDFHKEHMSPRAIESMLGFLKNGFIAKDGTQQRVWLIPSHASSFKIGEAVDGRVEKAADDNLELFAKFHLEKEMPEAKVIYNGVQDGTLRNQLSVGGEAIGRTYYNDTLKKQAVELVDVSLLEHVAVTRPDRSAVGSAGFLRSMMKSVESGTTNDTDSTLHGMLYKSGSSNEGDGWNMTPEQEAKLFDSIRELTKGLGEMKTKVESLTKPVEKSKDDTTNLEVKPVEKSEDPLLTDPNVQKYIAKQAEIQKEKDAQAAFKTEITKSVTDQLKPIVDVLEKIGSKIGVPVPRQTVQAVPTGAHEIIKEKVVEPKADPSGDGEPTGVEKAIAEYQTKLIDLEKQGDDIKAKRRHGIPFTAQDDLNAVSVAKQIGNLKSALHYMEVTGNPVK